MSIGLEGNNNNERIPSQNETIGEEFNIEKKLGQISEKYAGKADNFDIFSNYISNLADTNLQKSIIDALLTDDKRGALKMKRFLRDNGYPTQETQEIFLSKITIQIQSFDKKIEDIKKERDESKKIEEVAEQKTEKFQVELERSLSLVGSIDPKILQGEDFVLLSRIITQLEAEPKGITSEKQKAIAEFKNYFLKEENVAKIAALIAKKSGGIDSQEYKSFKTKVIALESTTIRFFEKFEETYNKPIAETQNDSVVGITQVESLNEQENYQRYGHMIIGDEGEYDAFIDISEIPPKREIGLKGSDYKIDTQMPILNLKGPIEKYERTIMEIDKKLVPLSTKLESFKTKGQEEYKELQEMSQNTILEGEMKQELLTRQEEILKDIKKSYDEVHEEIDELKKDKKEARVLYVQEMSDAKGAYMKQLKEKDEKKIKTLQFLRSIGFDSIPQNITDSIIDQLNSSTAWRTSLGFTDEINLAQGELGTNRDGARGEMTFAEQQVFVSFVNRMISGNPDIPNHMTAGGQFQFLTLDQNSGKYIVEDMIDKKAYINSLLGINPMGRIKQNLQVSSNQLKDSEGNFVKDSNGESIKIKSAEEIENDNENAPGDM